VQDSRIKAYFYFPFLPPNSNLPANRFCDHIRCTSKQSSHPEVSNTKTTNPPSPSLSRSFFVFPPTQRITMASQQSQNELLSMALSGQENMVTAAEEREQARPHTFLSLAPTTSASYPIKSTTKTPTSPTSPRAAPIEADLKTRRSSSTTSDGSLNAKRRFLKLGPVHHGEGDGDWSEEVVE
jgi:hypothetical protein